MDQKTFSVFPDLEALSYAAAGLFLQKATEAAESGSPFSVALSGGGTPQRTYELLASPPFRDQVPWEQVNVFWGDERCVPLDDPRSNANVAHEILLDSVPIPVHQVHPIDCAGNAARAARDYDQLLRSFFSDRHPRFSLIFLGLGEDGHTASLFPNHPVLREKEAWAKEVYVSGQDFRRVTLTIPVINHADTVAFLVAGAGKALALKEVHQRPSDPQRLPAQLIAPEEGNLVWLVDQEAASQLQKDI